jgi:hypothetical protein
MVWDLPANAPASAGADRECVNEHVGSEQLVATLGGALGTTRVEFLLRREHGERDVAEALTRRGRVCQGFPPMIRGSF